MKPISTYLGHDHGRVLTRLVRARARGGDTLDLEAYEAFRAAIFRHLALEEKILIPAVLRVAPRDLAPLFVPVELEHDALRALLMPTPDAALAEEVASFLDAHERAESGPNGVYALADSLLAPRADVIVGAMRGYPFPPAPPHADGRGAVRTVKEALDAALRARAARGRRPRRR